MTPGAASDIPVTSAAGNTANPARKGGGWAGDSLHASRFPSRRSDSATNASIAGVIWSA